MPRSAERPKRPDVIPRHHSRKPDLTRGTHGYRKLGLTKGDLVQLYGQLGTTEAVAARIGVCSRTVRYWFKALSIRGSLNRPRRRPPERASAVEKWLVAHPDAVLPRSATKAAALIGVPRATLASWLMRRARKIKKYVAEMGDLTTRGDKVLRAHHAETGVELFVPPRAIAVYGIRIDQWTLDVTYAGNLKVGTPFEFTIKWKDIRDFWKKEDTK